MGTATSSRSLEGRGECRGGGAGAEVPPGPCWLHRVHSITHPKGLPRTGDTLNSACPKNQEKWGTLKGLELEPHILGPRGPAPTLTRSGQPEVPLVQSVPTYGMNTRWQSRSGAEQAAPEPLSAPPSLGVEFGWPGGGGPAGR